MTVLGFAFGGGVLHPQPFLDLATTITSSFALDLHVLCKAFNSSELFVALASRFGTDSSERNISSQLMTEGFAKDGATKAAKAYIASIEFVVKETGGYTQNEQTNSGDTVDPVKADPAKIDPAKADPAKWNPPPPPHTSKEMSAVNYTFPSGETVTFNVPLGIVVDEDELQDFTDWVDLMTRKIKRGVKVAKQEKGVADSDE